MAAFPFYTEAFKAQRYLSKLVADQGTTRKVSLVLVLTLTTGPSPSCCSQPLYLCPPQHLSSKMATGGFKRVRTNEKLKEKKFGLPWSFATALSEAEMLSLQARQII